MEIEPAIVSPIIPCSTNPGSIACTNKESISNVTVGIINFLEILCSLSGLMNQPTLVSVKKRGGESVISHSSFSNSASCSSCPVHWTNQSSSDPIVKLVTLIPKLSIVALEIGMFVGLTCSSSNGGYLMLCTYLSMLSPQYGFGGPTCKPSEFGYFPEHLDS